MYPIASVSHSIWGSSSKPAQPFRTPVERKPSHTILLSSKAFRTCWSRSWWLKVDTWRFQSSFQAIAITDGSRSVVGVEFCLVTWMYTLLSPVPHHHILYILSAMASFLIESTQFVTVTYKYTSLYFHSCNWWPFHVAQFSFFFPKAVTIVGNWQHPLGTLTLSQLVQLATGHGQSQHVQWIWLG